MLFTCCVSDVVILIGLRIYIELALATPSLSNVETLYHLFIDCIAHNECRALIHESIPVQCGSVVTVTNSTITILIVLYNSLLINILLLRESFQITSSLRQGIRHATYQYPRMGNCFTLWLTVYQCCLYVLTFYI